MVEVLFGRPHEGGVSVQQEKALQPTVHTTPISCSPKRFLLSVASSPSKTLISDTRLHLTRCLVFTLTHSFKLEHTNLPNKTWVELKHTKNSFFYVSDPKDLTNPLPRRSFHHTYNFLFNTRELSIAKLNTVDIVISLQCHSIVYFDTKFAQETCLSGLKREVRKR